MARRHLILPDDPAIGLAPRLQSRPEHPHAPAALGLHLDRVRYRAQLLLETPVAGIGRAGQRLLRCRLTVDEQLLVAVFEAIPGQAHHPLDIGDRRLQRIAEHHHIAAFRVPGARDPGIQHRQAQAIGKFVHQDEVALEQGRHHRFRGNAERLNQE